MHKPETNEEMIRFLNEQINRNEEIIEDLKDEIKRLKKQKFPANEYQTSTEYTAKYPEAFTGSLVAVNYCALGLGEAGELQGKINKIWRGDKDFNDDKVRDEIIYEAGDILWYVARLAAELGYTLSEVMQMNIQKLKDRNVRGVIKGDGDNR